MGDITDKTLKNLKPRTRWYKVVDRDGMYAAVTPTGRPGTGPRAGDSSLGNMLIRTR
jgi:hypothetical protein